MRKDHTYYVYIVASPNRSTIYIGMTNNMTRRLEEHRNNRGAKTTFAGRYHCYELVYFEIFQYVNEAIAREKEIKKWFRMKKNNLVESINRNWNSLNLNFYEE